MALLNWPDFLERLDHNKVLALELAEDLLKAQTVRLERLQTALDAKDMKGVEQASHAFRGLLAPYGPVPLLQELKTIEEAARAKTLVDWTLPNQIQKLLEVFKVEVAQEVQNVKEELKEFDV